MEREHIKQILNQWDREDLKKFPDIINEILKEDQVEVFYTYLEKLASVCKEISEKFPCAHMTTYRDEVGIYFSDIANVTGTVSFWPDNKNKWDRIINKYKRT